MSVGALPDTRPSPRPAPFTPAGWSRKACADGCEQWTWTDRGVPVASAMVSPRGEVAPVFLRDPERYWMDAGRFGRAARAVDELARFVGHRSPR